MAGNNPNYAAGRGYFRFPVGKDYVISVGITLNHYSSARTEGETPLGNADTIITAETAEVAILKGGVNITREIVSGMYGEPADDDVNGWVTREELGSIISYLMKIGR